MFLLRRAAVRSLTCSPLKARTITTSTRSGLAFTQKWHTPTFQKRFASDEATKTTDDHEAVTTETDVAEKSVPDVADAASEQSSILDQVKDKAQEAASNVTEAASGAASTFTHAAESILGSRDSGASTSHDDVKPSRILYVGNLFFEIKGQDLDREFSPYGKLVNARVAEDARGLSRGFGFVEFETIQDAQKAQEALDQKSLAGRNMSVQYHVRREPRSNEPRKNRVNSPSKTLFVGNMSFEMSDTDLNNLFRNIDNVVDVRVAVDRRSGQPRGFCHADFLDVASAEKAKGLLETKEVFGRQLRVDYSHSASGAAPRERRYDDRRANRSDGGDYERKRPYERRDSPREGGRGYGDSPREGRSYEGRDGPREERNYERRDSSRSGPRDY